MANKKGVPDFAKVKEEVGFEELLKRYGLLEKLKRKHDQLTGACPIHKGEGKTSFSVNLAKKCFNCFSCKAHGNVLDFVAAMENISLKEAGLLLSEWFSIPLERGRIPRRQLSPRLQQVKQGKTAHPPSSHETGLRRGELVGEEKKETAGSQEPINPPLTFELKNLDQEHPYLAERGLTQETVKAFGLGFCSRGLMKGRVVIPIHNERGELVAYAGRWPGDDWPEESGKYKLPDKFRKSHVVFNLHRAKEHVKDKGLILVEGYFPVFRLIQAGFTNVAALMGSSLSEEQEELIVRAVGSSGRVLLLFDADGAGKACEADALGRLSRKCFVKVASLPDGVLQVDELPEAEIKDLLS